MNSFQQKHARRAAFVLLVLALGCQGMTPTQRAMLGGAGGAAFGGLAGGIIGNQSGNATTGAVIGAAAGAAVGALLAYNWPSETEGRVEAESVGDQREAEAQYRARNKTESLPAEPQLVLPAPVFNANVAPGQELVIPQDYNIVGGNPTGVKLCRKDTLYACPPQKSREHITDVANSCNMSNQGINRSTFRMTVPDGVDKGEYVVVSEFSDESRQLKPVKRMYFFSVL